MAVLFILAVTSISVYGIVLAGWASNSKYAVLGGIRASAQMISYELAMGLTIIIPVMLANSMDFRVIVEAQRNGYYVFLQPIAAIIFCIAVMAELQRAPFDLLEAEQELQAGFNVEYRGMRFGMFFGEPSLKMVCSFWCHSCCCLVAMVDACRTGLQFWVLSTCSSKFSLAYS